MASRNLHNILVRGIADKAIIDYAKKYFHGDLIDIGCGIKPYKKKLTPLVDNHIGVDHEHSLHDLSNADLIGSAYRIPAKSETFDSALCTAVLEHLEEPELALKECCRVLKKGGIAVYSIPFIWHIHEKPRDFYRYSKYGIEYLFNKTGFETIQLEALSGFWVTFGQMFVYYLQRFNRGPLRWFRIITILGLLIQGIVFLLDKIDKAEDWTWMYIIAAKKGA